MSNIELININKRFKKTIIKDLSYTFYSNNIYMISGKTGSGKSTLLSIIAKKTKFEGKVNYNDFSSIENLFSYTLKNDLINYLSGLDNLKLVTDDLDKIKGICNYLKINFLLDKKVSDYSNGEYQRFSFARLILSDKPVLLLDEPTSALDKDNKKLIYDYLYNIKQDKIIIIVSHDYEDDRFISIHFEEGEIETNLSPSNKEYIDYNKQNRRLDFNKYLLIIKNILKKNIIKYILLSILLLIINLISYITINEHDNRKEVYDQYKDNILFETDILDDDTYLFIPTSFKNNIEDLNDYDNIMFSKNNKFNIDGNDINLKDNEIVSYNAYTFISYQKMCNYYKNTSSLHIYKRLFKDIIVSFETIDYSDSLKDNKIIFTFPFETNNLEIGTKVDNTNNLFERYYDDFTIENVLVGDEVKITVSKELYQNLMDNFDKFVFDMDKSGYKNYNQISYKDIYNYKFFKEMESYASYQAYQKFMIFNVVIILLNIIIITLIFFALDIKFFKSKVILLSLDYSKPKLLGIYLTIEAIILFLYGLTNILYCSLFDKIKDFIYKYHNYELTFRFNYIIIVGIILSIIVMILYWLKDKSIFKIEKVH